MNPQAVNPGGDTREKLLELAERCEAVTGPDRELDCRIWSAANTLIPFDDAVRVVPDFSQWQAPHFTASLDAAMTLVPEGATVRLYVAPEATAAFIGPVELAAATPALALCAAALRARANPEEKPNDV